MKRLNELIPNPEAMTGLTTNTFRTLPEQRNLSSLSVVAKKDDAVEYTVKLVEIIQFNQRAFRFPIFSTVKDGGLPSPLEIEVGVWLKILYGLIPLERLQEIYDLAFEAHEKTLPLAPNDVRLAWGRVREKESLETAPDKDKESCPFTHDDEQDRLRFYGTMTEQFLLPCHNCRPKAHAARVEERKAAMRQEGRVVNRVEKRTIICNSCGVKQKEGQKRYAGDVCGRWLADEVDVCKGTMEVWNG